MGSLDAIKMMGFEISINLALLLNTIALALAINAWLNNFVFHHRLNKLEAINDNYKLSGNWLYKFNEILQDIQPVFSFIAITLSIMINTSLLLWVFSKYI